MSRYSKTSDIYEDVSNKDTIQWNCLSCNIQGWDEVIRHSMGSTRWQLLQSEAILDLLIILSPLFAPWAINEPEWSCRYRLFAWQVAFAMLDSIFSRPWDLMPCSLVEVLPPSCLRVSQNKKEPNRKRSSSCMRCSRFLRNVSRLYGISHTILKLIFTVTITLTERGGAELMPYARILGRAQFKTRPGYQQS